MADYKIRPAAWFGWWGRPVTEFDVWHWHWSRRCAERCAVRYFRNLQRLDEQRSKVETLQHSDGGEDVVEKG